ncbi:MAG: hypothetical protein EPO21_01965 [Chloroflexota bacterium]|nr:MAG: hypothetical protein EPO21_01965 [Chloroflexota bacterium]
MIKVRGIERASIAVRNLDDGIAFMERTFGAKLKQIVPPGKDGYSYAPLWFGDSTLELLCPVVSDSLIDRFIRKRGTGLYHVSLRVDSLKEAIRGLAEEGYQIAGEHVVGPLENFAHWEEQYIPPRLSAGVLYSVVEHSEPENPRPIAHEVPADIQVKNVHAISIACGDKEGAWLFYSRVLGAKLLYDLHDEEERIDNLAFSLGANRMAFLVPHDQESVTGKRLATRGPGLHHLSLEVEDLDQAMAWVEKQGVRTLGKRVLRPWGDYSVWQECFLHPKDTLGVMFCLLQLTK